MVAFIFACAIYMVTTILLTEFLKSFTARLSGGKALILSWVVGCTLFLLLFLAGCYDISWYTVAIFIVLTGLCNSAYRWTKLKNAIKEIMTWGNK